MVILHAFLTKSRKSKVQHLNLSDWLYLSENNDSILQSTPNDREMCVGN